MSDGALSPRFEDVPPDVQRRVAALLNDVTRDGAEGLAKAVVAIVTADPLLPDAIAAARRRLRVHARVIARRAERFGVEDLPAVLGAYLVWSEPKGSHDAVERLAAGLIAAAVAFDRTADDGELERVALELVRAVTGEAY